MWGTPKIENDLKLFGNFGYDLDDSMELYGHTNYAQKKVTGGFFFQNPHWRDGIFMGPEVDGNPTLLVGDREWAKTGTEGAGDCGTIPIIDEVPDAAALAAVEADPDCFTLYSRFPGGFTPQFGSDLTDYSLVGGLRGTTGGGLNWDASANIGSSEVDKFIFDTVNASLGWETPTSFKPGIFRQNDLNLNLDVSYLVSDMVHAAAGAEWRTEKFTVEAGDRPSWDIGPYADQGFSSSSNGFAGYREDTMAGEWDRSNVAVYGDVEFADPAGLWNVGTAVRFENFSDFGSTVNGKLSGRAGLTDEFSLRAAVSTGFRAPTPGQQNIFSVETLTSGGALINIGFIPSTSSVAMSKGGKQLEPETSRNYSVGAVFDQGPFIFTADFFRIDIEDQLAVTQNFVLDEGEIEKLEAEGIPEARNFPEFRFFVNDFSTTSQGIDLISTYMLGRTAFSLVFNYTDVKIKDVRNAVIDDFRAASIEETLPKTRYNFTVNHDADRWRVMGRANYFGSFWDNQDADYTGLGVDYPKYGGKVLVDAEVGIPLADSGVELSIGGDNILNTYPDEYEPARYDGAFDAGSRYPQLSPFGFNGAFFYTRINYHY